MSAVHQDYVFFEAAQFPTFSLKQYVSLSKQSQNAIGLVPTRHQFIDLTATADFLLKPLSLKKSHVFMVPKIPKGLWNLMWYDRDWTNSYLMSPRIRLFYQLNYISLLYRSKRWILNLYLNYLSFQRHQFHALTRNNLFR